MLDPHLGIIEDALNQYIFGLGQKDPFDSVSRRLAVARTKTHAENALSAVIKRRSIAAKGNDGSATFFVVLIVLVVFVCGFAVGATFGSHPIL